MCAGRVKFRPTSGSDFYREVFAQRKFDDYDIRHICDILESLLGAEGIPPEKYINFLHDVKNVAESYTVELGPWTPSGDLFVPFGRKVLYPKKLIRKAQDHLNYIPGDIEWDNHRGMITVNILKNAYVVTDGVEGAPKDSPSGKSDVGVHGVRRRSSSEDSAIGEGPSAHQHQHQQQQQPSSTFIGVTPITPEDLRSLADTSTRYMQQKTREELEAAKGQAERLLKESLGEAKSTPKHRMGTSERPDDRKRSRRRHKDRDRGRGGRRQRKEDIQILHYRVPPSLYATELPVQVTRKAARKSDPNIYEDPSSDDSSGSSEAKDGRSRSSKPTRPTRDSGGSSSSSDSGDESGGRSRGRRHKKRATHAPPADAVSPSSGARHLRDSSDDGDTSVGVV